MATVPAAPPSGSPTALETSIALRGLAYRDELSFANLTVAAYKARVELARDLSVNATPLEHRHNFSVLAWIEVRTDQRDECALTRLEKFDSRWRNVLGGKEKESSDD